MPVLRRRAAAWCLDHDRPEEALEYSAATGNVDVVAHLVRDLWLRVYWQGRWATLYRWFAG
jgi:ATP/maltotriose-dependent transcriptional regulator MalT